jgi:thiol-disulfide isomerase/thioredoxin
MTKPFGCATKWIEKQAGIARINEQWEHAPVTLDSIDTQGVTALLADKTRQFRLINVWATWCVPCVEEFPKLVTLTRQFQGRNFEMITLSIDERSDREHALNFLQRQHAALPDRLKKVVAAEGRSTDNYIFDGSVGALQGCLDPEWPGPVPYTLLVAPGGKILYRRLGAIDLAEVRASLVDALGPYYNPAVEN